MKLFTIGFTKKSAEVFFTGLHAAGVQRLVDVRLNNVSQLAGYTKREDLRYFAAAICGMDYVHLLALAPTADILTAYRVEHDWARYERQFTALMRERRIEHVVSRSVLDGACLLCSEAAPDRCHRRLVAEYLQRHWHDVTIEHLP